MLYLNCVSAYKVIWLFSLQKYAHKKKVIYTKIVAVCVRACVCLCVPIGHRKNDSLLSWGKQRSETGGIY